MTNVTQPCGAALKRHQEDDSIGRTRMPLERARPATRRNKSPQQDIYPSDCPFPTCQMETLERIQHAKREWETTADSLPHLIVLLDADGRITRSNRTVESWGLGHVEQVIGQRMHDLLHPGCADPACCFETSWKRAWQDLANCWMTHFEAEDRFLGRHVRVELRSNRCDGERRDAAVGFAVATVEDVTALKHAEEGLRRLNEELEQRVELRTAELLLSNRLLQLEVEERKRAEEALRESREQYRLVVETMNEGLAFQDANGVITYVNERLSAMLDCSPQDMIGRHALCYVHPECMDQWQEQIARRRRGESAPYEIVFMGRGEEKIFARVSPRPIFDNDGSYAGSFAIISDIGQHIRAEAELRASESELRLLSAQLLTAQERERKRIASELHDGIGQAMSAVKFSVESALRMMAEDSAEKGRETLEAVIPRVRGVIDEVRRISMDLRPSTLDDLGILATIGWFSREFQAVYQDLRIEKHISIQEVDVPPPLKTAMFRILQEAMNNLAKHAKADTARIVLKRVDNTIELIIEDNGQGFDIELVALHGRSARGAGLGSMRERAEFSGGTFCLQSTRDVGTRISVSWACRGGQCGSGSQ
jgi:PAS domain S-box-containing protein